MNILEFALNMEIEGNKYYAAQAELNKGNGLFLVFSGLAEDENKHAELIREKKAGVSSSLNKVKKTEVSNLFSDKSQKISEIKATPEQLDAYRFALEKEKESIDLYTDLLNKVENDKEFYEFLIEEEEKHFSLISDMVELLSHPKEWVESAEFGEREDY